MSLETPNRLAASINFFFALAGELDPPNEQIVTITAAEGIAEFKLLPEPDFSGSIEDGFMLTLMQPVRSTNGVWTSSGLGSPQFSDDPWAANLTPLAVNPATGNAEVDAFAASEGNWMAVFPDFDLPVGFVGIGIWEIPLVASAETPALPITLPVP